MGATPDELKAGIEQTRAELAAEVDALADRISPAAIARRRAEAIRSTAASVKERVTGSTASGAGPGVDSLSASATETVYTTPNAVTRRRQRNVVAVGLVASGAAVLTASLLYRRHAANERVPTWSRTASTFSAKRRRLRQRTRRKR